jgi:hypothetical protein
MEQPISSEKKKQEIHLRQAIAAFLQMFYFGEFVLCSHRSLWM